MNIAELKVLITGDDSGAKDALSRTSRALADTSDAAQALSDKLAELREATALGADASDRQVAIYEAMQGRYGDVRTAVEQLSAAYDKLEARLGSEAGWKRYSDLMREAQARLTDLRFQALQDRDALEAFGVPFQELTPKVQAFVEDLVRVQREADQLASKPLTGIAAAFAAIPDLRKQIDSETKARRQLNAEVLKQIQGNAELIDLGTRATKVEKELWDLQEGRLKAISPLSKAILEIQAKLIQQTQEQQKLEGAAKDAELAHAKLTATTEQEKVAVEVLGKTYQELSDAQKAYLTNTLLPLLDSNKRLADEQQRQAQIGAELNRQLARQYAEISKAGSDLGPLDEALKSILGTTRQLSPENQKLLAQIRNMQPAVEAFQKLAQGVRTVFDQVFQDLYSHGFKGFFSNVLQGFQQLIAQMSMEWSRQQFTRLINSGLSSLAGGLFGGGGGSALGNLGFLGVDALDSFFGSGWNFDALGSSLGLFLGRAAGGPVDADTPYLVGESGPELFVPFASGTIVPNSQLGGGGTVIHNHFEIHTPSPEGFRKSMGQLAAETGAAIQRQMRRNG